MIKRILTGFLLLTSIWFSSISVAGPGNPECTKPGDPRPTGDRCGDPGIR